MGKSRQWIMVLLSSLVLFLAACDKSSPTPGGGEKTLSVNLPADAVSMEQGSSGQMKVTLERSQGFEDEATLSLDAPAGITGTFSDNPVDEETTLSLEVADSVAAGSYTLTVKAQIGAMSKSGSINLLVMATTSPAPTPTPAPTTITVNGKVSNLSGTALNGLNIRLVDADGNFQETASDASGNFTVSNVKTPYSVSVVPPLASTAGYPQTWDGVVRSDPKLVVSFLGFSFTPACPARSANLFGDLKQGLGYAIPAGHSARVIYVAKGISFAPLASNETDYLAPGDMSYAMTVNFDTNLCETKLTGALIYLEKDDATKEYVKASIINNLELVSGDNLEQDVDVLSAAKNTIQGEVTFPDTIPGALIGAVLKVGDASVILDATYSLAVAGKKSYGFDVPVLSGVKYRTAAYAPNAGWTQLSFVYSDELNPGATGVNLGLPIVGGAVSPVSNIATITPTFNQRFVTGMNVYYSFVTNGANMYWFGTSSTNNTKMPSELPAPAQLQNANSYQWAGFTALKVRNATGVNDLLDGRLVKGAYAQISAWGNPDGVEMGMVNLETKAFNILP